MSAETTQSIGERVISTEDQASTSRAMRVVGRLAVIGLVIAGPVVGAQPAYAAAPSCFGDFCTGQYADQTGCDQDAQTASSRQVTEVVYDYSTSTDGITAVPRHVVADTLEVRKSNMCGTMWGRVILDVPTHIQKIGIVQGQTGHIEEHMAQNWLSRDAVTGTFFMPQIYTHNYDSQAVLTADGVDVETAYTPWASGLRSS